MDTTNPLARLGVLMGLVASLGLTGCGGSDSTPTAAPAPAASAPTPAASAPAPTASAPAPAPPASSPSVPAPKPDTAFATPADASDTAEGASISSYSFAQDGSSQTAGTAAYASGAVSFGATLASTQGYAGAALRLYAPGNTAGGTAAPFNASTYTALRIHLASTTDGSLTIKLQPSPVAADGCTPTATAVVTSTLSEFVIDLNDASFPMPSYCTSSTVTLQQVLAGLYTVDVINDAVTAGAHDVVVGSVSLVP